MMLNKNSIAAGILAGSVFPLISVFVAYLLRDNVYLISKPALPYLAAIALDLLVMRYCSNKGLVNTVKGIMMVIFIFMLALFIFKLNPFK